MPQSPTLRRLAVLVASTVLIVGAVAGSSAAATVHAATPSLAASPCPADRDHGDLYPDPDFAGAFYQCSWGTAYRFYCPKMTVDTYLHFNDMLKVCDWPDSAGNPAPIVEDFTDTAGPGPSGASANTIRATRPASGPAVADNIGVGGQITYTVAISSPQPHTAAHIRFSYPQGLSWVGGQDCFHYNTGQVDCMVYPAPNGFVTSKFTLQAGLLDLGPQTVTSHVMATEPSASTPIPDRSLTCTALTGAVVIC